jgi:hypothetical protein
MAIQSTSSRASSSQQQLTQMGSDAAKQQAEARKGAQYITDPAQLDNLQYQYWTGAGDTSNFNRGYSVNFQLDGKDYTFIPTDIINKGWVDGNTQYYASGLLNKDNLNTLKTKGQAIDLKGVGWYGDFLTDTMGRDTTGILIPSTEANKFFSKIQSYEITQTPVKGKVSFSPITGLAQTKKGDFVYLNKTPEGNYPGTGQKYATQFINAKGDIQTIGKPPPPKSGGLLGDIAKVASIVAPVALALVPGVGPVLSAAYSAGNVIGRGGSIEDAFKAGATSYAAGTVAGAVAKPVAGVTDSAIAGATAGGAAAGGTTALIQGNSVGEGLISGAATGAAMGAANVVAKPVTAATDSQVAGSTAGGAVAGGTSALLRGDSVTEGLLTGAAGGAIAGGVSATVDAGVGLLKGNTGGETIAEAGADETIAATGAETTGAEGNTMEDYELSTFLNDLDEDFTFGDQEGDYDMPFSNPDLMYNEFNPLAPGLQTLVQDFFDTNVKAGGTTEDIITKAAKQFGTSIVKSFLGIGGVKGVASSTRAALRAAGLTDTQIDSLGGGSKGFLESVLGGGAGLYLSDKQRQEVLDAYNNAASRVSASGREAADLSKFTPFGTKTAFGESKFTYDPTTGQLTGAEYTVAPEVAAERDRLFKLASGITPTATSMADYEQQYLTSQRGLLRPEQERQLGSLQERMARTGRSGFGYGQGTGMMATNPELAAYYNALATQEQTLAANAPTYARNLFSADIANLDKLYGQASELEKLGAAPLTTSLDIAGKAATAGATQGRFLTEAEKTAADLTARGGLLSASSKTNMYNELAGAAGAVGKTIDQYISDWMINNPQP